MIRTLVYSFKSGAIQIGLQYGADNTTRSRRKRHSGLLLLSTHGATGPLEIWGREVWPTSGLLHQSELRVLENSPLEKINHWLCSQYKTWKNSTESIRSGWRQMT